VAADKRKIYITVKLSSVTDACRGSDLDDRPKFNVAIIYEDGAAGKRAKHFYDRVIRELAGECGRIHIGLSTQGIFVPETAINALDHFDGNALPRCYVACAVHLRCTS
jgi:hypothetical protein